MSEHICPVHDWKIKWPLISDKASKSDSVIAVAAGTGSATALIIGVVVVIVVLRKRMTNAKGIIAYVVVITMIITVFTVFRLLTDFVCLYTYDFPFVRLFGVR